MDFLRRFLLTIVLINFLGGLTYFQIWPPDDDDPYNGYYWTAGGGEWIPGMISNRTWFLPAPVHYVGKAAFYAPGLMEATADLRGLSLEGFVDGVSLMSPADIGSVVWIRRPGHEWEGPFLSVDSARRSDLYGVVVHRGEAVEVGFETARSWGMVSGRAGSWIAHSWIIPEVEIWKGRCPPPDLGIPEDYRAWFLDRIQFVYHFEKRPVLGDDWEWNFRDGTFRTYIYDDPGRRSAACIPEIRTWDPLDVVGWTRDRFKLDLNLRKIFFVD